jgi:hypothetical protein
MREMRIATILIRTGVQSFADAEEQVDALFGAQLPAVQRDVVVVDNALPPGEHERDGARVVIGGDNSAREFSGFDVGLRFLAHRLHEYDWINLVTSAFNTLYTDYLQRFTTELLSAAAHRGVCLGHIDYYNDPVRLCGYPSQHWMRTSFVMVPPGELQLLESIVSVRDGTQFFTGLPERPFRDDAPICDRFKRYIVDWLTGQDIGQGVVWHTTLSLDKSRLPTFQAKTLAILNEHLLGVRLRAQGCLLADISWVASELRNGGAVRWGLPWREQMAACGRHVPVPTVI